MKEHVIMCTKHRNHKNNTGIII